MPKPPVPAADTLRASLIGLAHKAAKLAGITDPQVRRDVQKAVTGVESCADMNETQLRKLLYHYKSKGVNIGIPAPVKPAASPHRPTKAQWGTIDRLCVSLGLDEAQLTAFIRRTAHVDNPHFLTRPQASAVISGLQRWADQRGLDTRTATRRAIESLLQE